jgi:alpha-D-ribose 1-methylphosphonate 5-triphosphate synthase subunit PhnI
MLRAYRSTLPRFGYSLPARGDEMRVRRRISSSFRDIPGGQLLGRTRDYTQRLLDVGGFGALRDGSSTAAHGCATGTGVHNGSTENGALPNPPTHFPKVADVMRTMGIMERLQNDVGDGSDLPDPDDITRESMRFPVSRSAWLQALARGESGALVCLAYSSMRGYGGRGDHGTIAELRVGDLPLKVTHPLTGQPVTIGHYRATEVEMTGREHKRRESTTKRDGYGLSYGLVFGQHERKAIAMALLDSTLMEQAPVEGQAAPANDQEMVLYHVDGIESFGFVEHLKLPHFVTFGSGLQLMMEQRSRALTTSQNGAVENGATTKTAGDGPRTQDGTDGA